MDNEQILALVEKLTDKAAKDAKALATKLASGEIDKRTWKAEMLILLTSAHIIAASVGRGGVEQVTVSGWQKVKDRIDWQGGYLERFGRVIVAGVVIAAVIARRAASYANSPFVSYQEGKRDAVVDQGKEGIMAMLVQNSREGCDECTADAAEGWMPVDDIAPIGSRECQDYCKCDIEFSGVD